MEDRLWAPSPIGRADLWIPSHHSCVNPRFAQLPPLLLPWILPMCTVTLATITHPTTYQRSSGVSLGLEGHLSFVAPLHPGLISPPPQSNHLVSSFSLQPILCADAIIFYGHGRA